MVANDDGFIRVGTIDHANAVPNRSVYFLHHVLDIENDSRSRTTAVRRARNFSDVASAIDLSAGDAVAFESCKQGQSVFFGDGNGRDSWKNIRRVRTR